jgi:hypothetical protein
MFDESCGVKADSRDPHPIMSSPWRAAEKLSLTRLTLDDGEGSDCFSSHEMHDKRKRNTDGTIC